MSRLLYIEDEAALAEPVRRNLQRDGFTVDLVATLDEARAALGVATYDAVVLDLGLTDGDGLTLITEMRAAGDGTVVIIVTARDGLDDRILGLNSGADDYVIKPFATSELTARLRAVLRRPGRTLDQRIVVGALSFDTTTGEAWVGQSLVSLSRRESAILDVLMRRGGRVVQRSTLEESVYGFGDELGSNALEAHLSRLRRRLTDAGADTVIHNVRGVGYLLKACA